MDIDIRELPKEDMSLLARVNREETIEEEYLAVPAGDGMSLTLKRVRHEESIEVHHWDEEGCSHRAETWASEVEKGGVFLGAFDTERLVGFAVLGHKYGDGSAELSAVFVDSDYRRKSVGSALARAAENEAAKRGVKAVFIYSVATAPTVDFYRALGYHIVSIVDKSLVSHLPWDVVLAKRL